jgi:hypothetical protein
MIIKLECCIEIEFKVFKNQFECTNIRQKPKVCYLYSIYFPVLQYWHFNLNKHFFVLIILQTYINIFNVKVHCFILKISPIKRVLEYSEEHSELIMQFFWKVSIIVQIMRQEFLHCSFKRIHCFLLNSQQDSWIHSNFIGCHGLRMIIDVINDCMRNNQKYKELCDKCFPDLGHYNYLNVLLNLFNYF